jgi:hypothetical protein
VTEEFGQEEGLDEGRAVEADERSRCALARAMKRVGDQLLARTALTADEDRAVRACNFADRDNEVTDLRVVADDLADWTRTGADEAECCVRGASSST